jgi:predicted nucleic acid-binding protein
VITWIELLVDFRGEETAAVETWLACFPRFPLDDAIAREAVRLRQTRGLKVPDAIILATGVCHGLTLATRNARDFPLDLSGMLHPYRLGEA